MFGSQSLEIFWKKMEFSNSQNLGEKVRKKFRNSSSEKSLNINQNCMSILKFSKNYVEFKFLSQKTLFLGQKDGKSSEKFGNRVSKHTEISEIVLFRTFRKLQKMMLNSNFGNGEKLVLIQKLTQKFG